MSVFLQTKHRFHGWERGIKDRLKGKELDGGAGDRGKIFSFRKIILTADKRG
jgi:hypothetical protein